MRHISLVGLPDGASVGADEMDGSRLGKAIVRARCSRELVRAMRTK